MRGAVTTLSEHIQPVQTIVSTKKEALRVLLQQHGILDAVQQGTKIILLEGKNLSDLDQLVPAGKKIAIISINLLGGG
jgi:hypothetical protein